MTCLGHSNPQITSLLIKSKNKRPLSPFSFNYFIMGTAASIGNDDEDLGSAEPCKVCNTRETSARCEACDKVLCVDCCPHRNKLFQARAVVDRNEPIIYRRKTPLKIRITCGTYNPRQDQLNVACELFFKDKHCNVTSKWEIYRTTQKKKNASFDQVSKRAHETERSFKFVGDMCSTSRGTSYFTFPCQKSVYKLDSSSGFSLAFETDGSCFGIASFLGGLALSIEIPTNFHAGSPWQVRWCDSKGTVKRQIYCGDNEQAYFRAPYYLCSNTTEDTLYVSDQENNAIYIFDAKCVLIKKITDSTLTNPRGVACDGSDNVYIACETKVVQLQRRGLAARTLLELKKPEVAMDVCFDVSQRKLIVIQQSGMITVFNMMTTPPGRSADGAKTARF